MKLSEALKLLEDNEIQNVDSSNVCLISKENIQNKITLNCNHSFEYMYLYYEIIQSSSYQYKKFFECPYCRTGHKYFIPYNNNIPNLKNDNINRIFKNDILKCTNIMKSGKNKGQCCNKMAHYFNNIPLCITHYNINKNKNNKNIKENIIKEQCSKILKNGNQCKNKMCKDNLCKLHYKLLNTNN